MSEMYLMQPEFTYAVVLVNYLLKAKNKYRNRIKEIIKRNKIKLAFKKTAADKLIHGQAFKIA